MNLKVLLAGITWFQKQLTKFVKKSETANKKDTDKMNDIQSKVDERTAEIKKAKNIGSNISKLVDE